MYNPTKPYKHSILRTIERTWHTPYVTVERGLYPIITKKFSLPEVQHTDGIGTKGWYHWQRRTFSSAVHDALAMNLNDLAMVGAYPYALQNHLVLPKDDHRAIRTIVEAIAKACVQRKIAMTGGETSIHADMPGMDISMTLSGFVHHKRGNRCRVGDTLIGLASSGLHSNGFTKVREVFGRAYHATFTTPTRIYSDEILRTLAKHRVHGMMHITGGAFSKLKDILDGADAEIVPARGMRPHKIFFEMHRRGLSSKILYTTFNCGIGFVLSVPRREVAPIMSRLNNAWVIGNVVRGEGKVSITSAFDGKKLVL